MSDTVYELEPDEIRANILAFRRKLTEEAGPNAYIFHECHRFGQDVLDELDAKGQ